jgi:hypothetical protein
MALISTPQHPFRLVIAPDMLRDLIIKVTSKVILRVNSVATTELHVLRSTAIILILAFKD